MGLHLEIITDGGKTHGIGHLRRSQTLQNTLKSRGYLVHLRALSEEGHRLLGDPSVDQNDPSLIVLDLPYAINELLIGLPHPSIPIIALDQFGGFQATLTISLLERSSETKSNRLSGLQYAIIREDILVHRNSPEGDGVLVMIGGGDLHCRGREVALRLAHLGERVTLIEGPLYQSPTLSTPNITHLRNPADLAQRMTNCRWAVTNGGTTMMEMMYLGKPVFVAPQTPDENRFSHFILDQGGLLGMGDGPIRPPSVSQMRIIREKSQQLIDGKGSLRIAAEIEKLL